MRFPFRRSVAGLLFANYLVLLTGLPVPVPVVKDTSRPFPCQDHRCGCRSADQCWRSCCCLSHEQKLAWARENGVTPPAEMLAVKATTSSSKARSCCTTSGHGGSHRHVVAKAGKSGACCSADTARSSQSEGHVSYVVGIRALECGGGSASWCVIAAAVMPLAPVFDASERLLSERLDTSLPLSNSVALTFDPPPPRA